MQNDVLANTNKRERMRMASDGENVEALVTKNEPEVLAELIKNGYAQNHYEEWKTHEHGTVRYALACLGLFPETFINDKTRVFVKLLCAIILNIVVNCWPEIKNATGNSCVI